MLEILPLFVVMGFAVSVLVGLTGMGGGALTTPFLILLGITPTAAVGSDIAFTSITRALGSLLHWRRQNIDFRLVRLILYGSVPAAIASYLIYGWLESSFGLAYFDNFLTSLLAILLVGTSIIGIWYSLEERRKDNRRRMIESQRDGGEIATQLVQTQYSDLTIAHRGLIVAIGAFVGFAFEFTSVGSGTILVFLLLFIFRNKKIVGSTIFYAFLLTVLGTLLHAGLGDISPSLVLSLAVGGIPGTFLGVRFNSRLSFPQLRGVLNVTVLLAGVVLILRALVLLPH